MQDEYFFTTDKDLNIKFDVQDLIMQSSQIPGQCLFIKDIFSNYQFANINFIQIMGLDNLKHLKSITDFDLTNDKVKTKKFHHLDQMVVEEGMAISVSEEITPNYNRPIRKLMNGQMYPIFSDSGDVKYVLGMVTPKSRLIRLDWDTVFNLSTTELNDVLVKRSYQITCQGYQTTLSKMEIKTLIQLIKGQAANEISENLNIKQTTVESYLKNIRNKLGVSSKSELIHVLIRDNVLHQIIV